MACLRNNFRLTKSRVDYPIKGVARYFQDTLQLTDIIFHNHACGGTTDGRYLFGFGAGLGGASGPIEIFYVPCVLWHYMDAGDVEQSKLDTLLIKVF